MCAKRGNDELCHGVCGCGVGDHFDGDVVV